MRQQPPFVGRRQVAPSVGFTDYYLAAIPTVDMVLNQVGSVVAVRVWTLSLFQVVRGALLLLNVVLVGRALAATDRGTFRAVAAVLLFPASLAAAAVLESARRSGVAPETIVAVLQTCYWVSILALVLLRRERAEPSSAIANGILLGGAIAAVSVLVALAVGGGRENAYQLSGVDASWGWFLTMKGLTGQLLVAAIVGLMVGGERKTRWPYAVSGVCALATFLTYARTGLVALVAAAAWLLLSRWRRRVLLIVRDVAGIVLVSYLVLSVPHVQTALTDNLALRWQDVLDQNMRDQGKSGSGRATLLPDSWREFLSGDAGDVWFGRGFAGMLDAVQDAGYIRIHTHDDLLDVLLVGGLVGLLSLTVLLVTAWRRLVPPSSRRSRWRYAVAIAFVWAAHAAFTGQLWLPDAMSWYILGLGAMAAALPLQAAAVKPRPGAGHPVPAMAKRADAGRGGRPSPDFDLAGLADEMTDPAAIASLEDGEWPPFENTREAEVEWQPFEGGPWSPPERRQ